MCIGYALICGIDVAQMSIARGTDGHWHMALMSTDRWHFWGHTDHQGTHIISALMITVTLHFYVYM
ncbi:unnamed protein product [Staurois parvus]|uniref:Uncharacterized protein n=1 Tax=Staurois parvus TaxID=386267 RepID=A0ABN9EP76_9NEOB|nr:unnamed protein product [Staurois parvus]